MATDIYFGVTSDFELTKGKELHTYLVAQQQMFKRVKTDQRVIIVIRQQAYDRKFESYIANVKLDMVKAKSNKEFLDYLRQPIPETVPFWDKPLWRLLFFGFSVTDALPPEHSTLIKQAKRYGIDPIQYHPLLEDDQRIEYRNGNFNPSLLDDIRDYISKRHPDYTWQKEKEYRDGR